MTRSNVAKLIEGAAKRAGLPHCHPHQLRHTCGHLLADAGHDTRRLQLWLGHSDIKHTARYSELSARPCPRLLALRLWRQRRATTQRWPWIRLAIPAMVEGRDGFRLTEGHSKPNGELEHSTNSSRNRHCRGIARALRGY
jgi:hypothetical protein